MEDIQHLNGADWELNEEDLSAGYPYPAARPYSMTIRTIKQPPRRPRSPSSAREPRETTSPRN
jgi:hypothetical protein